MFNRIHSFLSEVILTSWVKRAKRRGFSCKVAETVLIRTLERKFDRYYGKDADNDE